MTASAQVPGSADLPAIAAAAGNTAFDARRWEDGVLYVDGVSQEALDAAVASVGTAPAVPVAQGIIFKADLWRRCTDDEAATLDAALEQAPARLRRIFDGAQYLDPADPDYPAIRGAVVTALGQSRADAVLAPS